MIPIDIPYKVIKYLVKLSKEKVLSKNYQNDKFIIHLKDRGIILDLIQSKNKFTIADSFKEIYIKEIFPSFQKYSSFIKLYEIENLENYCTIDDLDKLILISIEKPINLTFQEILTKYFKSSKHTHLNSNLAKAIKIILDKEEFDEDNKDQQYISILYPKNKTRYIILCENKNKLKKRHDFIEFWYVGGNNTEQLQFVPAPKYPIFYLFDWDFDGLRIYINIKQNYFPTLNAFLPLDYKRLIEKQEEVKHHQSKWIINDFMQHLNEAEKIIASYLIKNNCIIEEQKILLSKENLIYNSIK